MTVTILISCRGLIQGHSYKAYEADSKTVTVEDHFGYGRLVPVPRGNLIDEGKHVDASYSRSKQ